MLKFLLTLLMSSYLGQTAQAKKPLVSKQFITNQKKLTSEFKLKNGIPVIYREIQNSDILQIDVNFSYGMIHTPHSNRGQLQAMFSSMTKGAKGWPKEKIYQLTEKYAAGMNCSAGIEISSCSMSTINDYWEKIFPAFAASLKAPLFEPEEINLVVQRSIAELKSQRQDPGRFANEVVNRAFYGPQHPYRMSFEKSLKNLKAATSSSMQNLHKEAMNANRMFIVVAGSLPISQLKIILESYLGRIPSNPTPLVQVKPPLFIKSKSTAFEHREIPTAYIKVKFNLPGIHDRDSIPAKLMLKILDEELSNEIRTRLSLSYAVYAFDINYQIGLGVISASTSQPEKTLAAIERVVRKVKTHNYSPSELDEFRTVYATSYFLTLEEHSSLVRALASSYHYFGTTERLDSVPIKLAKVSPPEIRKMANMYLVNFRVGVVFDEKKMQNKWAMKLVQSHLKK